MAPTTSTMCTHRVAASMDLESFFRVFAWRLGSRLQELLAELLRPGETMPDLVLFFRLLGRHLELRRERLDAAGHRHRYALGLVGVLRRQRDEAASTVRQVWIGLRRLVRGGEDFRDPGANLAVTGLVGRLPRRPFELWLQARSVASRAADAAFARNNTEARIADRLAAPVRALGKSLRTVADAGRRVERTRYRKHEAMKELETSYVGLGQLARTICVVLGEDGLADSTHRPLRSLDRRRRSPEPSGASIAAPLTLCATPGSMLGSGETSLKLAAGPGAEQGRHVRPRAQENLGVHPCWRVRPNPDPSTTTGKRKIRRGSQLCLTGRPSARSGETRSWTTPSGPRRYEHDGSSSYWPCPKNPGCQPNRRRGGRSPMASNGGVNDPIWRPSGSGLGALPEPWRPAPGRPRSNARQGHFRNRASMDPPP